MFLALVPCEMFGEITSVSCSDRVKNSGALHRTFNVQPLYLRHENTGKTDLCEHTSLGEHTDVERNVLAIAEQINSLQTNCTATS